MTHDKHTTQLKDNFLLDDTDAAVIKELGRRQSVRARADQTKDDKPEKVQKKEKDKDTAEEKEKDSSKWQSTHQELAEKRSQADSNIQYYIFLVVACL